MLEVRDELAAQRPTPLEADIDDTFRLCSASRHWNGQMPLPFPITEIQSAARLVGVQAPARLREVVTIVQSLDRRWREMATAKPQGGDDDADA